MRTHGETHPWITFSINLSRASANLWVMPGECNALCQYISSAPLLPENQESLYENFLARSYIAITGPESNYLKNCMM